MIKRNLLVLILVLFITTGVFAQRAMGGGILFANDFGGGIENTITLSSMGLYDIIYQSFETPVSGGGAFFFFDTKYFEFSLALYSGSSKLIQTASYLGESFSAEIGEFIFSSSNFGFFGKYPFEISEKFTVFPAIGIDVINTQTILQLQFLRIDDEEVTVSGDLNTTWFKLGGGFDYSFSKKVFLRFSAFYGIRLYHQFDKELWKLYDYEGEYVKALYENTTININSKTDIRIGHGFTLKVAVGSRL
ncbi:MAG: hypothetical protein FWD22_05995 [Treponema sp.]|nr:hypothetical protein [Treponema sp.]